MEKAQEIEILEQAAASRGLAWSIAFESAPAEPFAFRLVAIDGHPIEPHDVIGENFEQALNCITLTAHMLRRVQRAMKGTQ